MIILLSYFYDNSKKSNSNSKKRCRQLYKNVDEINKLLIHDKK